MKWFKHDTDANMDAKLQSVMLDYGLEGYGLYWYCIELIAQRVNGDNLTFELEHDARIIARNTGSTPQKVEQMMTSFINLGLLNADNGHVFCLKLASRCDDFTAKAVRRKGIKSISNQLVGVCPSLSDKVHLEEEVRSKKKEEEVDKNKDPLSGKPDVRIVIDHFNLVTGQKLKVATKSHSENISGRLSDGYTVEELKMVIDFKNEEWSNDPKMAQYIRPATLFQTGKFGGYLAAAKTAPKVKTSSLHNLSGITYQSEDL